MHVAISGGWDFFNFSYERCTVSKMILKFKKFNLNCSSVDKLELLLQCVRVSEWVCFTLAMAKAYHFSTVPSAVASVLLKVKATMDEYLESLGILPSKWKCFFVHSGVRAGKVG